MDESGDFWRSVTTEMTVRHSKRELAPPAAFQSVLAVAAAVMQRETPQKKKSLTGKSGKAQPVPPTGIEPVRCFHRGILSPLRLPVPPQRHNICIVAQEGGNVNLPAVSFCRLFCGTGAKSGFPARRHKKFTFCRLCFCFEFVILIWYVWIGAPIWAFI